MLISLIIPTRERAHFLEETLKTATTIPDADIEIVVSDNASCDDTREVVERCDDARVKYVNTGERVAMRQNFEFALEHSSGDYVIFIGDDDGFLPRQFQCLRQILERDRPDVLSWKLLTYRWPIDGFGKRNGRVRVMRSYVYGEPRRIDLNQTARRLHDGQVSELGCVPAVYHGCASRKHLEDVKARTGFSFGGRIPDVYFTFHSILSNAKFLHSLHPFTVNGISPASTGNAHHGFRANDKRIKPAVQFGNEAATDPVQDVVAGYVPTIPLNLFSTYETVCDHLELDVSSSGRQAWYQYVLAGTGRADADVYDSVFGVLEAYAKKTDTESELQAAVANSDIGDGIKRGKVRAKLNKLWTRGQSVKCSASRNGVNTVFTAAQLIDDLLASDYSSVLDGRRSSIATWARLVGRALKRGITRKDGGQPLSSSAKDQTSPAESPAKAA